MTDKPPVYLSDSSWLDHDEAVEISGAVFTIIVGLVYLAAAFGAFCLFLTWAMR